MSSFGSFLSIHFEVGGDTWRHKHQERYWQIAIDLVNSANLYGAKLTLQFNPQWAEYILLDMNKIGLIKKWQHEGHEVGLHHH